MKREEAKQSIERIRSEKLEKDSADLRALLKILAEELNSKDTHFIWELLQNAEDNEYDGAEPALSLHLETTDPTQTPLADGCLVVLNNETGFEEKHALGICSAGNGTKKRDDDQDYIGEKGIGFKSVFCVSDRPHIFSNGYQFRFARPEQPGELGYILPHWVEDKPSAAKDGWTASSPQAVSDQVQRTLPSNTGGASQPPPADKQQQQQQRAKRVATDTRRSGDIGVKFVRAQAKRSNRRASGQTQSRQGQSTLSQTNQGGGLDSLSRAEKNELEDRAIKKATEVLKSSRPEWGTGYDEVEDVHDRNLGYDLHAKRRTGESLRVELKAHRGAAKKVNVTRKEWKEFMRQTLSDHWELWNVELLDGDEIVMTRHNKIPSHALEPSAYWIDLNECSWSAD